MYVLSQILVIISDIFCIISMLNKKKSKVILFLIISTILFTAHYFCLGAYTGAVIGFIEMVFLLIMYLLELKQKIKYNTLCSVVTICITVLLSILTWNSWISVLPMVSMVIYLVSMLYTNVIIVKSGVFIRLVLNSLYMLLLKSYFGAGLTVVILIFNIWGIINDSKLRQITIN